MYPVLFELPWGAANGYGTAMLVGLLVSFGPVVWDVRTRRLVPGHALAFTLDLFIVLLIFSLLGGRLAFVLTQIDAYLERPALLWHLDTGGFVFFGALAGAFLGLVLLARRHRAALASICDVFATWMPLGHAFGRVGCYAAGCCYGAPTDRGWGVRFPSGSVAHDNPRLAGDDGFTTALHPVQLYECAGLLVLFVVLLQFRLRRGSETPWRQASRYALGYGSLRLITELFRGDSARGHWFVWKLPTLSHALGLPEQQALLFSTSQGFAAVLVLTGIFGLRATGRRAR